MRPGSVFAFLAEHRGVLFPVGLFADLFPSTTGRPSLPVDLAASVLVLQTLLDLSDRETVEAVRCDLRWKVACGLSLDYEGFHPSTLTYWRGRLSRSERPNRIFDAVRAVVAETGVLRGKKRRAVDSVVFDDAVATQDTITQLIAAIRRVGREVPGGAEVIAVECTGHDYTDAGKPDIAWDDKTARDTLVSALVTDALRVVAAFEQATVDKKLDDKAAQAVALLALVAGQDVEPAAGSDGTDGQWRIARKVAPDRVISTVDPEARHVHKTVSHKQDGYKGHLVAEPDTGLFTGGKLTRASGEDNHEAVIGCELIAQEPGELEVLGDTAYGTADARAALVAAGHLPVIKPMPPRPAVKDVEDAFILDDFRVDEDTGAVTCPNGVTRQMTAKRNVVFGVACRDCPLRARCTTSKDGRTLHLHPHDALLRQARQDWRENNTLRETYRQHRPMIERSISWLIGPKGRCRKLRYRGVTANDLWLHLRMAGLNLRRLLNLGLTRRNGTWNLA